MPGTPVIRKSMETFAKMLGKPTQNERRKKIDDF
jgi:hypothetical protein